MLSKYGIDVTNLAEKGELDLANIRDADVEEVMQILCKRRKNNPCLLGSPGTRVASVIEGLAQRIVSDSAPVHFRGKKVIHLKKGHLLAGCEPTSTQKFGQRLAALNNELKFGQRLAALTNELQKGDGNFILFLDDLDLLVQLGSLVNQVQCIGVVTHNEYKSRIESNSILKDRFYPVNLAEYSEEEIVKCLKVVTARYEAHHNVKYMDAALTAAAQLSSRFTGNGFLIDKAIDIIDVAAARVRLTTTSAASDEMGVRWVVTKQDVEQLFLSSSVTSTRLNPPSESEGSFAPVVPKKKFKRLDEMKKGLQQHVVGQQEAVEAVSRALLRAQVGIRDPSRPVGSFFFTGPSGIGKTELANAVAIEYFGSLGSMMRLDMSEYKEPHSVSKLFGSPPGYVSNQEGGQLTNFVLKNPHSVLLFDEIEKAHHQVYDAFLQILENGRLTDGRGIAVDFTNTVVIFTSNVGYSLFDSKQQQEQDDDDHHRELKPKVVERLKKVFRPELLNRLDDIIVFRQLTRGDMGSILEKMLNKVKQRVKSALDLKLEIRESVKKKLMDEGYDPAYGARPLRRCITRIVEDALALWVSEGEVNTGDSVSMDLDTHGNVVRATLRA